MILTILKNKKEVADYVSSIITSEIKKKPNLVMGLATGRTMIPIYKSLSKLNKKNKTNFSKVRTFNLDEYLNASKNKSLRNFMEKNFFRKVNLKRENINFLNSSPKSVEKECLNYERKIKSQKGIDLQILGIGRNGHIGFNEPDSSLKSKTREVKLSESTKKANSSSYQLRSFPTHALTIGIGTILKSRKILLIATGKDKADIVVKTLKSKISQKIPASSLKKHNNAEFILDTSAARKLIKQQKT